MARPNASKQKLELAKAARSKLIARKTPRSKAEMATVRGSAIRLGVGLPTLLAHMGPLRDLPGNWTGKGFDLIWRPFQPAPPQFSDHFLQLNLTDESLQFRTIDGDIPNRGLGQGDITLNGLRYLQRINDANFPPPDGGGALHLEPGLWVHVPATTFPPGPESVVRIGSIPHGNAFQAQSVAISTFAGPPVIPPANTNPFPISAPPPPPGTPSFFPQEASLTNPSPFRTDPLPPGITQALVDDPNSMLRARIAHEHITSTTQIDISTTPNGGIANIPFLTPNADVALITATFWIETIKRKFGHGHFMQLQYSQTVLLNFAPLSWPHVTVSTLARTF